MTLCVKPNSYATGECARDLGADWSPRGECAGPTFMWTRPDTHHSNPQLWANGNG